jgi:glycosyltransferase involved in cell wall biosynthesis
MPKVSVLMPVFNGEKYIHQAIESILVQTYRDFELVVVDDGSTDRTAEIINTYTDTRIRYIQNSTNLGLAAARNRAIEISNGQYLAWLDSDDISSPTRLEKQVGLLNQNKEIVLTGTWVKTIEPNQERIWRYPTNKDYLRARFLFDNPFATSSVMLKRTQKITSGLKFDSRYPPAEDYDLWVTSPHKTGQF